MRPYDYVFRVISIKVGMFTIYKDSNHYIKAPVQEIYICFITVKFINQG